MAGGSGTRLWPESRKNSPKQTKTFSDGKTLLQKTFERLSLKFNQKDIWITTNQKHLKLIQEQLSKIPLGQYSLEPARMDTAAAIGLVNLKIYKQDPESSMVNINSDAYIANEKEFISSVDACEKHLNKNPKTLVGIGIIPAYPETGYGYIKKGKTAETINSKTIYAVDKFVEKPDKETAEEYLRSGKYLWNPTLLCWKTKNMLKLFEQFAPKLHEGLMEIYKYLGTDKEEEIIKKIYPTLPKTSIDYAIFEKAPQMAVLEADFGWNDVGSWNTVKDIQSKTLEENVTKGDVYLLDSKNSLVYGNKKFIAGIGLEDLIVVDTDDALLICKKDKAQDVKKIITWLEDNKKENLL